MFYGCSFLLKNPFYYFSSLLEMKPFFVYFFLLILLKLIYRILVNLHISSIHCVYLSLTTNLSEFYIDFLLIIYLCIHLRKKLILTTNLWLLFIMKMTNYSILKIQISVLLFVCKCYWGYHHHLLWRWCKLIELIHKSSL